MGSDRTRALELLEEALAEARRIDDDNANRALLITVLATQFFSSRHYPVLGSGNRSSQSYKRGRWILGRS